MNETSNGPRYLTRWDHSRDRQLAREVVVTSHRLAELDELFGPRLGDVIDGYPREALSLTTWSDDRPDPSHRLQVEPGRFSGSEMVEMIRRGRLWLTLADLQDHHPQLSRIVDRLYAELRECHPGLRTFAEAAQLQIHSSSTPTQFHCELEPIVHWNLQGCRRLWVYPCEESCLPRRTLEELVSGERKAAVDVDPALDGLAQVIDLMPGQMISIPQYMPHRIQMTGGLNVTLVTRHLTPQSERQHNVHLANRLLRRMLRSTAPDDGVSGPAAVLKDAAVRVLWSGSQSVTDDAFQPKSFGLDPDAPGCIRSLTADGDFATTNAAPSILTFDLEAGTSLTPVVEF